MTFLVLRKNGLNLTIQKLENFILKIFLKNALEEFLRILLMIFGHIIKERIINQLIF